MNPGTESTAVCVVLYESVELLEDLMRGIRAQTRSPDRIVFCINGPDDGAKARLAELAPEATLIERPDNPGFAGGMNAAIAAAGAADRVFLLNPDVQLEPRFLEVLHEVLDEEPTTAGAGGLLLLDEERIDSAGFRCQPWLRIVDRGAGSTQLDAFTERESVLGVCAAAALFRRSALAEVAEEGAVFDPDFFMYKEDQDLCLRLRAAGFDLRFEPRARARHARGWAYGGRGGVSLVLRRHSLKNRYLLLIKHLRPWRQLGNLPFLLGFELLLFLGLLFREPRTLKAYLMALRLVASAYRKRQQLLLRIREGERTGSPVRPVWNR